MGIATSTLPHPHPGNTVVNCDLDEDQISFRAAPEPSGTSENRQADEEESGSLTASQSSECRHDLKTLEESDKSQAAPGGQGSFLVCSAKDKATHSAVLDSFREATFNAIKETTPSTALPSIMDDLGSIERYSWIATAYIMTCTAIMPICGKLSLVLGRRSMFATFMTIFTVASLLCGLARTLEALIAYRALQVRSG
ncbi:hypothetical protein HDU96_004535 [Phlyctochytrium bullatum]|nr:hypothetical protein HDU96_004535 [Phlyctochytrium bullatum]